MTDFTSKIRSSRPAPVQCQHCGDPVHPKNLGTLGWLPLAVHPACADEYNRKLESVELRRRVADAMVRLGVTTRAEWSTLVSLLRGGLELNARWQSIIDGSSAAQWGFVSGGTGTGKTTQAQLFALRWMLSQGTQRRTFGARSVVYVREEPMLKSITDRTVPIERYSQASVLIVDEMGNTTRTDARYNNFAEIISARHSSRAPTLLLSNYGLSEMMHTAARPTIYTDRTVERIIERVGGAHGLLEFGNNHRMGGLS